MQLNEVEQAMNASWYTGGGTRSLNSRAIDDLLVPFENLITSANTTSVNSQPTTLTPIVRPRTAVPTISSVSAVTQTNAETSTSNSATGVLIPGLEVGPEAFYRNEGYDESDLL